ncbi:MAG: helix-turn-helix domain-containing protein [Chloroflexi bacterium]|nr:helix-turn-helix domain-containing protein [Chloroflexota bacterium]
MNTAESNKPRSVSEVLLEELKLRDWSQNDLAEVLGQSTQWVSRLVVGRRAIDADVAVALGAALGTTAEYWLDIDSRYRLANANANARVSNVERRAKIFSKAPVTEMIRRGWIPGSKDMDILEGNLLSFFNINSLDETPQPIPHAARKSTEYTLVTPPQMAWLFRARNLSQGVAARSFTSNRFEQALDDLKTLLEHPADIRRVPAVLAEGGVRLLVVQPLSKSRIDGASFWLDSKCPVIVLSMRFDRIDYFWHTLWHELGHVHNRDSFALDQDMLPEEQSQGEYCRPESELMADNFAVQNLVPQDRLDDFILRVSPLFSRNRLVGFSKLRGVHPGIVVGQLQHRGEIGYTNHRNLLVKVREILIESALTDGFGQILPVNIP